MAKYISLINWTDQGIKSIKDSPKRADTARAVAKKLGCELKKFYLTLGSYDLVAIVEAPDDEAAAKFVLFAAAPILGAAAFQNLRGVDFSSSAPMEELSWLTFGITWVVTLLSSLLAIGGFMKSVQRKGFGQYALYRCALAAAILIVFWMRA